jgi:hypothetical protein
MFRLLFSLSLAIAITAFKVDAYRGGFQHENVLKLLSTESQAANPSEGTCLTTTLNSLLDSSKEYAAGYTLTVDTLTLVTMAASVFLLFFGAMLVKQSIALMGLLGGFYTFFKFSQLVTTSCNIPTYGGIVAGFLLAGAFVTLVDAVFFIAGAAIGGVGMYLAENVIVSHVPSQYSTVLTEYWWLVVLTAALTGGFLLKKHEMDVFAIATCTVGAPGFVLSLQSLLLTKFKYQMTETIVALSMAAVFIIGLLTQLRCTKD